MPPAVTHVVGVFELSRGRRLRHDRLAGVNYFFRRIAAPDWLLMGGRCLTVIVTGSNKCGGRDGNETQWIGTSGAHCGGSRSVFDERAFCEADDFARVCRDHGLSPKCIPQHAHRAVGGIRPSLREAASSITAVTCSSARAPWSSCARTVSANQAPRGERRDH